MSRSVDAVVLRAGEWRLWSLALDVRVSIAPGRASVQGSVGRLNALVRPGTICRNVFLVSFIWGNMLDAGQAHG